MISNQLNTGTTRFHKNGSVTFVPSEDYVYENYLELSYSLIENLSKNPPPKELAPYLKSDLSDLLLECRTYIELKNDPKSLVVMMQWINDNRLNWNEIIEGIAACKKEDPSFNPARYMTWIGIQISCLMDYVGKGHSVKDVTDVDTMIRSKLLTLSDLTIEPDKKGLSYAQHQLLISKSLDCLELVMKAIKNDPLQRDAIIGKLSWILGEHYDTVDQLEKQVNHHFPKPVLAKV